MKEAQQEKYYTTVDISEEFHTKTDKKKVEILYDALSFMQEYNGRTKFHCIAMALGYNNYEGETNTYTKK